MPSSRTFATEDASTTYAEQTATALALASGLVHQVQQCSTTACCCPSSSSSANSICSRPSPAAAYLSAMGIPSETSNVGRRHLEVPSWINSAASALPEWADYRISSANKAVLPSVLSPNVRPVISPSSPASEIDEDEYDPVDSEEEQDVTASSDDEDYSDSSRPFSPHSVDSSLSSADMSPSSSASSSASTSSTWSNPSSVSSCSTSMSSSSCSTSSFSRRKSVRTRLTSSKKRQIPSDCFPSPKGTTASSFPPSQWAAITNSSRSSPPTSDLSIDEQSKRSGRTPPFTFPAPTPVSELRPSDLESCLRFAAPGGYVSDADSSAPPAFFPLQRVSFAPQLKIRTPGGIPLAVGSSDTSSDSGRAGIAGMMLGVTGMVEIIDAEKSRKCGRTVVKTQRMIADFATDLTNGLKIWRRDAGPIVKEKLRVERQWRARYAMPTEDLDDASWEEMLAPGTFMLPLSMKIPCSDKLPPSFESAHFRIRYTMSLALFSSRKSPDGRPEVLHCLTTPFHVMPSTLPTLPPQIPTLTHDTRKDGFLAGMARALSLTRPTSSAAKQLADKTCTHIVSPSIPTSSFSPGSVIPITLRIADCPTEPTDLYIRLSLIRKIYVRDSAHEAANEWGLPEDIFMEEFCKEEEEIVSRWGYVPYSVRAKAGAAPGNKAQVVISDITLPVGSDDGSWDHGYTSFIDLGPSSPPSMQHGECSWFSAALSERKPLASDYQKYVHASSRHFISIEIGFAPTDLGRTLREISECVPDMEIPSANTFTCPKSPSTSPLSGLSVTNPFACASSATHRVKRAQCSPFQHAPQLPAFPGKMKEILIPVTIGSVAEPQMSCIANRTAECLASVIPSATRQTPSATAEESAERAARDLDESEAERYERVGDDGEEAWLCPPPSYKHALKSSPAYV